MFGTLQVVPSWLRQFGELKNGKYVLTSERKSIMSSGEYFRRQDMVVPSADMTTDSAL